MKTKLLKRLRKRASEVYWVEYHGWEISRKYNCCLLDKDGKIHWYYAFDNEKDAIEHVDYKRQEWILDYIHRTKNYRIY